jgi:hypothetical protein
MHLIMAVLLTCAQPHYHDFDFWLGSWTVRDVKGKVVGRNDVTRTIANCVVQEHWYGARGGIGSSFNIWNVESGKWHQTWVDNSGGLLLLDGGLVRGSMVLGGTMPDRKAGKVLNVVRWTPLPDGRVRQHWTASSDGGKTWQDVFDGYYSKRTLSP